MSNNNNQINVPEAKEAMNRFKMECANEVGVNLKQGYNGDRRPLFKRSRFRRRSDGKRHVACTTNRFYAEFVGFKGANRACCVYIRLGGITSTEFHKI